MAGLPGTGKSTIARALSAELRGIVFDKDLIRAALFPEPWIEYSQQQDDFCIELLLQSAAFLLTRPRVPPFIFIDGRVFAHRYQIDRIVEWANTNRCRLKIIHTVCSDESARARLATSHHPAANRNYDLYLQIKARFEPIEYPKLALDTDQPLESTLARCVSYLRS